MYVSRSTVVDAVQFTGKNHEELVRFVGDPSRIMVNGEVVKRFHARGADMGIVTGIEGYWLVRLPGGEFRSLSEVDFEIAYMPQ